MISKAFFVAACLALTATAVAKTPGAALNINVFPTPQWGNYCDYNILATVGNKPAQGVMVEFFFSGQHKLESPHYFRRTGKDGFARFDSFTIPYDWKNTGTWVNANAVCAPLGVTQNWRIKQ